MRILHFRVLQGLGNRLAGLLSAFGAAEVSGRDLLLTWERTAVCGAHIDDLWEHDLRLTNWLSARALKVASGGWRPDRIMGSAPLVSVAAGWTVASEIQPRPPIENYKQLRLRPELQARVDAVAERFGDRPVIGVAIRAHRQQAHPKSLKFSPVQWYEQRLEQILAAHPDVAVFASVDTPDVAAALQRRWPEHVVTLPDKGTYASVRGLQDALCDVHLLAGCAYLLGAHASSMTGIARDLQARSALETSQAPSPVSLVDALADRPHWSPLA